MAKTKHTILCVDDEKTVLDSLKNQLRGIFGTARRLSKWWTNYKRTASM
jgi:hypothetical protein